MKSMMPRLIRSLIIGLLVATGLCAQPAPLPHLEKRGQVTQLIVDGRPWLILGGEIANTASSDLAYMETVWPQMTRLNLNTVLVAVAWAWVEPEEGKFDFSLVDRLLEGARKNDQRVIFLWFGSWKNGISSFVPAWVKRDTTRFPRVRVRNGLPVEIVSPFSREALEADTRAYVKFMEHLGRVDGERRTTIMVQLQNEIGVLGDSRDRGEAANAAFAQPVPTPLLEYLGKNRMRLSPVLRRLWESAGARTAGTWTEVFGATALTDELFMAWHFGRFLEHMSAAGKRAYPLPVFTNTWIVQPEDRGPGDYPSGAPQPHSLDVWKAAAPSIDLMCPDIYLPNFPDHVAAFHRADNPLFVPESRGDAAGVANAFYAIGQHAALGYSPFGIDNTGRLVTLRPESGANTPVQLENTPLARGYAVLRELAPLILEHQAKGAIASAWLTKESPRQEIALGDHKLIFEVRRNRRNPTQMADFGYALAVAVAPDEYVIAGTDVQVTFAPSTSTHSIAGIADASRGSYRNGQWRAERQMSGDDILLEYDLAKAAVNRQSGSGLFFGTDGPIVQRVKLYRYE
jgi:hypothetical protein